MLNRRIQRVACVTVVVCCGLLLAVGHLGALKLSNGYHKKVQAYSETFAEYLDDFNVHFSDFLRGDEQGAAVGSRMTWDEIKERLTFKDTSKKNPQKIVKANMDLYKKLLKTPVREPKVEGLVRAPTDGSEDYQRADACFAILVRNHELRALTNTIRQVEKTFNSKFHYPYVLLNDKPFSAGFQKSVQKVASGEVYFEQVPPEQWDMPADVDQNKVKKGVAQMLKDNVGYADKPSYHNMCRFYSGAFFTNTRMKQFRYYWRLEPGTEYFCDIDYDVFKFMEKEQKTYGFVITLYDIEKSMPTLWPTTLDFVKANPQYVHPNASFSWLTENLQNPQKTEVAQGYSTCHFWSNFEIGDMNFFRGEAYQNYVKALDAAGGFYYERWGDAPVHSIGLGLFEDRSKIHWFRDIGYRHDPYEQVPTSDKCDVGQGKKKKTPGAFSYGHLYDQNCMANWVKYEMNDELLSMY